MSEPTTTRQAGRVTATVRAATGWPIPAVLTLLSQDGTQIARADVDTRGAVTTDVVAPGTYTALFASTGFEPQARIVRVDADGSTVLGPIELTHPLLENLPEPGRWEIDPAHSRIAFVSQHLGISAIRGEFTDFHGMVTVAQPIENSAVEAQIDSASLTTGNAMRDTHLRSTDFLDVTRHRTIEFHGRQPYVSTAGAWRLPGDLSLAGSTRDVELTMNYTGTSDDPWGSRRAGFSASTELRREDFNITYGEKMLSGIALIGSTIRVELDIQTILETG